MLKYTLEQMEEVHDHCWEHVADTRLLLQPPYRAVIGHAYPILCPYATGHL